MILQNLECCSRSPRQTLHGGDHALWKLYLSCILSAINVANELSIEYRLFFRYRLFAHAWRLPILCPCISNQMCRYPNSQHKGPCLQYLVEAPNTLFNDLTTTFHSPGLTLPQQLDSFINTYSHQDEGSHCLCRRYRPKGPNRRLPYTDPRT